MHVYLAPLTSAVRCPLPVSGQVNYTYQFLAQKFHVFSQFLFDDYISSNLSKERRWFKKNKVRLIYM